MIQQPASPIRSLTGLQIWADTSRVAQSANSADAVEDEKGCFIMDFATVFDDPL